MVSSKPVPSRAALNALRGLVFTTSCSVFILAEERRRRMRIARSAFDNARKLHTVKARHRPALLADTRLSDEDCEALLIAKTSKPERRKRRPRLRSRSDESDAHNKGQKRREDLGIGGSDQTDLSSRLARSTSSRRPLASTELPIAAQKSGTPPVRPIVSSRDTFNLKPKLNKPTSPTSHSSRPKAAHTNRHAKPRVPADFQASMATLTAAAKPGSRSFEDLYAAGPAPWDPALAQEVSDFLGRASGCEKAFDHTVLPLLGRLLVELDPRDPSIFGAASRLEKALEIFEKLSTVGAIGSHREAMEAVSVAMIKYAVIVGDSQVLALNRTRRFFKDVHRLLAIVSNWMIESNVADRLPELLGAFCNSECSGDGFSPKTIYHILACHATLYQEPSRTIELYHRLHQPRLRSSADSAFEAQPETRQLLSYLLQDEMQRRGIYQAAHSPAVHQSGVQSYGSEASRRQFQDILVNLVDTCSQRHAPANFEAILRYLARTHGLELKGQWVYPLIMRYSRSNGLDAVFSWIQFCLQNNFRVDDAHILRFYRKCHTNWNMPWEKIGKLSALLSGANSNFHVVDWTKAATQDGEKRVSSSGMNRSKGHESWERLYIRTARELVSTPPSKQEVEAFDRMQRHARKSEWSLVWESYEKYCAANDAHFSIRCLRLAVLAQVRLDGGATESASRLLWSYPQHHDVSDAATAVLMAQLSNGERPSLIISTALDRGLRVHDMVYNLAAQKSIQLGHLADAMSICQTAIAQNGNGDFLYQEFIFLNLVSTHISQVHYSDLKLLLAAFMEKKPQWGGTEVIKRTLKLEMKTVVKRIAMASGTAAGRHEKILAVLEMALQFNADCTASYGPSAGSTEVINSIAEVVLKPVTGVAGEDPPQVIETYPAPTMPTDGIDGAQQASGMETDDMTAPPTLSKHQDKDIVPTTQSSQEKRTPGLDIEHKYSNYQDTEIVTVEENTRKETIQTPGPDWDYFSEMEGAVRQGQRRAVFPKSKPKERSTSETTKLEDGVLTKRNGDNAHEVPSGVASSELRRLLTGEKKMMYDFLSLQPRVVPGWSQCEAGHEA